MTRSFEQLLMLLCFCISLPCTAHEVRPAYFEILEDQTGNIDITWKQPVVGERALPIRPHLSSGWLEQEPTSVIVSETAMIVRWHVATSHAPLAGQTITIQGLEGTLTDVLVSIKKNNNEISRIISATHPQFALPADMSNSRPAWSYIGLGITHIWSGPDHLLYVLGLILIVATLRPLLLTLTSFTLAHSITLALTTLNFVRVPQAPVEAVIALSIVYLAVELQRQTQGQLGWASTRPWLIAFPFGLLHGFGFAGALREAGLPTSDTPAVLLFFNLGIEAGQIAFVLAVVLLAKIAHMLLGFKLTDVRKWSSYVLGSIASYWLITRIVSF